MKTLLSIIIVSFNSKDYLDKCLTSLNKSTFKSFTEIIIVDNASVDKTEDFIRKKYRNVSFIQNKKNNGFSKANNQGIKRARGKYILLLNPDTVIPSQTLEYMANFMDKHLDAGISTCRVELANGNIDDSCHRGFPTPWNALCHFTGISKIFPGTLLFNGYHLGYRNLDKIHPIDSCTGAFMLIRKTVGQKLSWLDEDYFWYGEDIDFCFRIKKAGFQIYFVPQVKITHYKGMSSGIKIHSEKNSTANFETKLMATKARFAVMKIFYRKHFSKEKSKYLIPLIFAGIKLKEQLTLLNLKIKNQYAHRI